MTKCAYACADEVVLVDYNSIPCYSKDRGNDNEDIETQSRSATEMLPVRSVLALWCYTSLPRRIAVLMCIRCLEE